MSEVSSHEQNPSPSQLVSIAEDLLEGQPEIPGGAYREVFYVAPFWKEVVAMVFRQPSISGYKNEYKEVNTPISGLFYPQNDEEVKLYEKMGHSLTRTRATYVNWERVNVSSYQPAELHSGQVVPIRNTTEDLFYSVNTQRADGEGRQYYPAERVIFNKNGIILRRMADPHVQRAIEEGITEVTIPETNTTITGIEPDALKQLATLLDMAGVS